MDEQEYDYVHAVDQMGRFLTGVLVGGLVAGAITLLLAPQSGQETNAQIEEKGKQLREQAAKTARDAAAQIRRRAGRTEP